MPNLIPLAGRRVGRLLILPEWKHERRPNGLVIRYWLCQCDCGNTKWVCSNHLRSNVIRSCGCLNQELRTSRHRGVTKYPEYSTWGKMLDRCRNPNSPAYPDYGGRGIYVCARWQQGFELFYEDMGPRPTPQHTVERRDNDGPYSPENCYWATRSQQCRNYRRNKNLTFQGQTLCITDWAKIVGIDADRIADRVRSGWTHERALTEPIRRNTSTAGFGLPSS